MMNKRGVTPLIATLMLISFSIGLGTIVMSWGQHYIEEKAEFITAAQAIPQGCNPLNVNLITIADRKQLCLAALTRTVQAFLENGPDVSVDNLQARIVGSEGVDNIEAILQTTLARSSSATASFQFKQVGDVKQIKLVPYITVNGRRQYCESKAITVDGPIQSCS